MHAPGAGGGASGRVRLRAVGGACAERAGAAIATAIGGVGSFEECVLQIEQTGPERVSPFSIVQTLPNLPAGWVSIELGTRGPLVSECTACAASNMALGDGFDAIRLDRADVMFCGGTEAPVTPVGLAGFGAMRALSVRNDDPVAASRPFDGGRDGFVIAEGAAVVVLEELSHAAGARRPDLRRADRLRHLVGRESCLRSRPERREPCARAADGLRRCRHRAGRRRLRERARHLDTRRRRGGDPGAEACARRGERLSHPGLVDEGGNRAHPRCGRARSRRCSPSWPSTTGSCRRRSTRRIADPDCDLDYIAEHARDRSRSRSRSRTRSASAGTTPRSCSVGGPTEPAVDHNHPEGVIPASPARCEPVAMLGGAASSHTRGERPRVVVLGGGFAGLGAARKLEDADVDVVLVDANDYHSFQPMLYQLATGLLDTTAVAHSLRDLFRHQQNATVHQATVTAVDLDRREVQFADMPPLQYDYLVVGLGAVVQFFGCKGAAENAFPLYTVEDALRLRSHLVERWESADRDPSLVDDGALNVVVVGGGPTGIESVGALTELYRSDFASDYRSVPPGAARLILVEAGPCLFPMFKPDIREYAQNELEERGVEIMLGERVDSVEPTRVTLASGTVLPAHTLIWGAGLQASPLTTALGVELQKGNRIAVDPELRLPDHPEVFAVGDAAWITDAGSGDVLPQLGSVALQAGEHAGENIASLVAGKEPKPFKYHDKGTMAAIARGAAVAQLHSGRTMKGEMAFLAWGGVHLTLLSAWEDRTKAMVDWTWGGFSHERPGRILVGEKEK